MHVRLHYYPRVIRKVKKNSTVTPRDVPKYDIYTGPKYILKYTSFYKLKNCALTLNFADFLKQTFKTSIVNF